VELDFLATDATRLLFAVFPHLNTFNSHCEVVSILNEICISVYK
jgi:hypothetical protein